LQKLRGSHGFSKSEDAIWVKVPSQLIEPLMDVVPFEETVGGQIAAAITVGARVGH
jgi:hypothetical protein